MDIKLCVIQVKKEFVELLKKQKKKQKKIYNFVFGKVLGKEKTFLIQNIFPTTEKYIESKYQNKMQDVEITKSLKKEIIDPYKVQNNNFNIEKRLKKIKNNKRISDSNKKIISKKINSFSKIFTKIILENDTNKIKIYKNLKFQKYSADYCIEYNNHVIAITINETRENIDHIFHNCYFLSIRTKAILNDSTKINYKFIDIKIISD